MTKVLDIKIDVPDSLVVDERLMSELNDLLDVAITNEWLRQKSLGRVF